MYAPEPKFGACQWVVLLAVLDARVLGWKGSEQGLTREESQRLAELMDAVHNLPGLAMSWERCDEELLRRTLANYDARHGGALLHEYDRFIREHSPPQTP